MPVTLSESVILLIFSSNIYCIYIYHKQTNFSKLILQINFVNHSKCIKKMMNKKLRPQSWPNIKSCFLDQPNDGLRPIIFCSICPFWNCDFDLQLFRLIPGDVLSILVHLCISYSILLINCKCRYEAWVIYNFLSLCLAWVGGPGAVVLSLSGKVLKQNWCLMTCCFSSIPLDG